MSEIFYPAASPEAMNAFISGSRSLDESFAEFNRITATLRANGDQSELVDAMDQAGQEFSRLGIGHAAQYAGLGRGGNDGVTEMQAIDSNLGNQARGFLTT